MIIHNDADSRYRVGWLIDGSGGILRNVVVAVQGGLIVRCEVDVADPPTTMEDWTSGTLLPGLIDAHVHLSLPGHLPGRSGPEDSKSISPEQRIAQRLSRHMAHGVVGLRDGGDRTGAVCRWRTRPPDTPSAAVAIRCAGAAWHQRGRYGRFIGCTSPLGRPLAEAVRRSPATIDHIKILQSGINSLSSFGRLTPPQFSRSELASAVAAARARGLPVMVHANGPAPALAAIEAGCTSIEHGYFMDDACLTAMAERRTVWVPTLAPIHAIAESPDAPAQHRDVAARMRDHQMALMTRARALGVVLATGTDAGGAGVPHGIGMASELALFMAAGMTAAEAVTAATSAGAALSGIPCGRLAAGAPATFLLVPGPPEALPGSLADLRRVVINGRCLVNRPGTS